MSYYVLKCAAGTKETGPEFPQIQEIEGDMKGPDSPYKVIPNKFPHFTPNLEGLLLHTRAKLTDILSSSMLSSGLLVNEKVKEILQRHNLVANKFYPAKIKQGNSIYGNYYWFFIVSDLTPFIDYEKTHFYITDFAGKKEQECNAIKNHNDLKNLAEVIPYNKEINSDLIYFNSEFERKIDLFEINTFNFKTYISDNLKQSLEQHQVTGVEFIESNKVMI